MKVTIFNGNPQKEENDFDKYLEVLKSYLISRGTYVQIFQLKNMNINQCTGCFGCWTKKPGECLIKDDHSMLCENYINSDFVLFTSPLIMGFTSALLKKAADRLIPLLNYKIELVENECHHLARYDKYPDIGVVVQKESDSDSEDLEITNNLYQRMALNFKASCRFTVSTEHSPEEIYNEINSI